MYEYGNVGGSVSGTIIGESILADQLAGSTYLTRWSGRGGNKAGFAIEVIAKSSEASTLTVQVETKNSTDGDNDATDLLGTPEDITLTTGTTTKFDAGAGLDSGSQGFKELYRLKYLFKSASANALAMVHFRELDVSWLSN